MTEKATRFIPMSILIVVSMKQQFPESRSIIKSKKKNNKSSIKTLTIEIRVTCIGMLR
ncbi:hypothetical protein HanXRQr2_Chr13g0599071 [Helianthus annuus]|uniref:Uncharacterized protein n=1 Tax=Helianthus annuus TaxID=4232 RepID=A0A9K3HB46_HELAN|nr:hypothetical protein HanXRQr2_Chr13g0599071 [Helianthus annuus]KAJ0850144.1 hypothetical protein HanPSC8_Chr13g0577191 [Helianthus annuus]